MPSLEFSPDLQHETKIWDRFIRNRDKIQNRILNVCKDDVLPVRDSIIDQKLYSKKEETYKYLVASALSLRPRRDPWAPQWPVKPRNNPHLHSPRIILDLPNIRRNIFSCNIMDWSATSYLTVAFPRSVYLWHSPTNRTLKIETKNTSCLKWNPEGTDLFIASRTGSFMFADVTSEESAPNNRTTCHVGCFITSCAFHPKSPLLFMGCSMGSVSAYHVNKGLHKICQIHVDHHQYSYIMSLGLSCDGRHLAVANMANFVFVYDTINFAFLYSLTLFGPSRALAWHPWKKNLLVVSDCNGFMALYDVQEPNKPLASYYSTVDSSILNLAFNPVTAELVVSQRIFYSNADRNVRNIMAGRYAVRLSVLSSFDRVVDRMEGHLGPVHFLNWSPDGTQLATAGADETARIWDFLPQSCKQRTTNTSCKPNCVSASLELGNRMGLAIR